MLQPSLLIMPAEAPNPLPDIMSPVGGLGLTPWDVLVWGCILLLILLSLVTLGAIVGIRASGKRVKCVILLHKWVPMTSRTMHGLGLSLGRPNLTWGYYECSECGRPSIRRRGTAKTDQADRTFRDSQSDPGETEA